MQGKPVTLLVIEDDEVDVMAIKRALNELKIVNPIVVASDGVEGLEYLRGENGKDKISQPYIILLDINMPRMNGLQFLDEIRKDKELRSSTVFVLTTSDLDEDIVAAYDKNVAGYIVKSDTKESFREAAAMMNYYWTIVELPGGKPS